MAQRKAEARTRIVVGLFVILLGVVAFVSLFIIGQTEGAWERKTEVVTDFKTIAGLRKGSPVQLAGVEIGSVSSIEFIQAEYPCEPVTEDIGRFGDGRTDLCDEFLFCSPTRQCADLEPYAQKGQHMPCLGDADCGVDEVCVTKEFRGRARRVQWIGPDGVCARFSTSHQRVRVRMTIFEDKLDLIRTDSRATIASNGVLGDQLVNLTPGMREPLPDDRRVQSTPSLYEDIVLFRERFDGLTDKVDKSLAGISALFSELNDERTINAVKGTLENVEEITRQMAAGEGLVGALLSDEEMKADFGVTLRSLRDTAAGVDTFVGKANRTLGKLDEKFQPLVDDASATVKKIREVVEDLKDPNNKSLVAKLLYDEEGKLREDVEQIVADAKEVAKSAKNVAAKIERGEGTLGKFVNDPKVHDDIVKLFQQLDRNTTFKRVTRYAMEAEEGKGGTPEPAPAPEPAPEPEPLSEGETAAKPAP